MRNIKKNWLLLILIGLLVVSRQLRNSFQFVAISDIAIVLVYVLFSGWHLSILKSIKEIIGINRVHELTIKVGIYATPLLAIAERIIPNIIENANPPLFALVVVAVFELVSICLLAINFQRLLSHKKINREIIFVFFQIALVPLGVWFYQDKIKEWHLESDGLNMPNQQT